MGRWMMILGLLSFGAMAQEPTTEKLPLKVLYAGNAGTPYTTAWMTFLTTHTNSVKFVVGSDLKTTDLAGVDVLIIDGEVMPPSAAAENRLKSEKVKLTLDDIQGLPVVLMGGQGGFLSDELGLKTSWKRG